MGQIMELRGAMLMSFSTPGFILDGRILFFDAHSIVGRIMTLLLILTLTGASLAILAHNRRHGSQTSQSLASPRCLVLAGARRCDLAL